MVQPLEKNQTDTMSRVSLSSPSHSSQAFSHCFVRAPSILILASLSMPLCSLVHCLECWQQSETLWNDSLGAAWMSSTQDQTSGTVWSSWKRTPLCHVMERRGEGRQYGNSTSPPIADHHSAEKEVVNY